MDKQKNFEYIDVDKSVIEPSPQRVRNILTLEERVRAIQAYDCRPMYTKVAKMFNCSWEQIKNIIANREAIIKFYDATKQTKKRLDPDQDEIRQRKITFLGECMYEYIQRVQFHTKADLTPGLINIKAIEFRDMIQIDHFTPNKTWINHFKATYNFSLSNRQILLTRTPPSSLDLKDIMTYCTKNKSKVESSTVTQIPGKNLYRATTKMAVSNANDATVEELKQRRQRKIHFLEKALFEYIQRSQYHHKIPINDDSLGKISSDLKSMLKIDNFYPNKKWISGFKNRFDINLTNGPIMVKRTPPLSLDLKDILSYCSRHDNTKPQISSTITLAPKDARCVVIMPKKESSSSSSSSAPTANPIVKIPITTRLLNCDDVSDLLKPKANTKKGIIALDNDNEKSIAPNNGRETNSDINETIKVEINDEEEDIKPNILELDKAIEDSDCHPPPFKILKIESIHQDDDENENKNEDERMSNSPGHWSETSDRDVEDLPKSIRNYNDALKLLKPLEEFALLEENYRVIGLISQLEEIFKNPKNHIPCKQVPSKKPKLHSDAV